MSLEQDIQQPAPGAIIDLYELDLTPAGFSVPIIRFHPGLDASNSDVVYDSNTYTAMPVAITGFSKDSAGPMPRPLMTVSNVAGYITQQMKSYNEFIGAKVTRIRTLAKYLDNGSSPDTTANVIEIYYVEQKKSENNMTVQFELVSAVDILDKKLPGRPMFASVCTWAYKSTECSWPGTDPAKYFDSEDQPTGDQAEDQCSKSLTGCKLRFGELEELPSGLFPALGKIR